jgi:hypothetical protein
MTRDGPERRRFNRIGFPTPIPAEVGYQKHTVVVSLSDISAGGARVFTPDIPGVSLVDLACCIGLNGSQLFFRHRAQVVRWSPNCEGDLGEAGLEFLYGRDGRALKAGMLSRALMAQFCEAFCGAAVSERAL